MRGRVLAVLEGPAGRRVFETSNLVTTAGDVFYAQRGSGLETTDTFDALVLCTGSATPAKADTFAAVSATDISGSLKRFDAGYPKNDDQDVGNTGAGAAVITYRVTYSASEANSAGIERLAITNYQNGSPGASEPLLCHAEFAAPFTKAGTDTLTVYWNHEVLGA
jgi:hypothetical protein